MNSPQMPSSWSAQLPVSFIGMQRIIFMLLGCFTMAASYGADQKLPFLQAKGVTYTNVTVFSVTPTDVHFTHAGGMANAKLQDLDSKTQKLFGYNPAKAREEQKKQAEANIRYQKEVAATKVVPRPADDLAQPPQGESLRKAPADEPVPGALTKAGDLSPVLSIQTVNQGTINFSGQVVVLSFFATWCGPCRQEMPYLEQGLWQPLKDAGLVLIAVGREHSVAEVQAFQKQSGLTFLFAADPKREIYGKFATETIPRCVVIGKDGRVKYQTVGFSVGEVSKLIARVKVELE
jgi:peroxiredoxin